MPDHRGYASNGPERAAFLPTHQQATEIYPNREKAIHDLHAPSDAFVTPESETDGLRLL